MKKYLNATALPRLVPAVGGIGIALRFWLLSTGVDEKGLLLSTHPASLLLWLLCAATITVVILGCLPLVQANKYSFNFPPSLPGAVGEGVLALGILVASIQTLSGFSDPLATAAAAAGFLSVPALCFCALCRRNGAKPMFLFHGLVCVFWILRLVSQYRGWSSEPQLQAYFFPLFANVFMMLACYQRTAFDAAQGNRRAHALTHLAAVFFCCLSVVDDKYWFLYGACTVWALTDLCRLTPMPGWKLSLPKKDVSNDPA